MQFQERFGLNLAMKALFRFRLGSRMNLLSHYRLAYIELSMQLSGIWGKGLVLIRLKQQPHMLFEGLQTIQQMFLVDCTGFVAVARFESFKELAVVFKV